MNNLFFSLLKLLLGLFSKTCSRAMHVKMEKTLFGIFPSCSPSLNDFRTVFVFASGPFLPMAVILVSDFSCCNYNGDAAPKFDLVITFDWGVLLTHVQQF